MAPFNSLVRAQAISHSRGQATFPRQVRSLPADNVDRTWDHVFPRAWYPDTTAPDVYKWQIPSHPCNRDYGAMEEDLLFRLALCVDPHVPETAGIVQKALRSMKP